MTDRPTDRLSPVGSLTADERARARLAFEAAPDLMQRFAAASLVGDCEIKLDAIAGVIRSVRCPAS
ncbi:MAG TPA: hypothetical protein VMT30_09345 [Candidatus Saccharimonadia bacterium]|nr:hypothetical protein [Candidatus Saccharimonadia bacterium]